MYTMVFCFCQCCPCRKTSTLSSTFNHAFPFRLVWFSPFRIAICDCSRACLRPHVGPSRTRTAAELSFSYQIARDFECATHRNSMDIWTWQSYLMILLIPFRQSRNVFSAYAASRSGRGALVVRKKKTLMIMMTIKYTHISFDVIRCASDITGTRFHTLLLRWPTFDERAPSSHPPAA